MSDFNSPIVRTPWSPKVIAAGVASFLAPTAIILFDYLLGEGRGVFAGLPLVLQVVIFSVITSAVTLIASYAKRDVLREEGQKVINNSGGGHPY